jgi:hypothetical protein
LRNDHVARAAAACFSSRGRDAETGFSIKKLNAQRPISIPVERTEKSERPSLRTVCSASLHGETVMAHLKILTASAALLVSLATTPVFAQVAPFYGPNDELGYEPEPYYEQNWSYPAPYSYYGQNWSYPTPYYYGQNWTYDNSGWNGYNNGGYNNTWFDGRTYRSDPRQGGEDIAADAASVPFRGYANEYGGSYAQMGGRESVSMSGQASCEQRFKSYDPASGTYRGRDGKRHACH